MSKLLYSFIKGTSVLPKDFWLWWLPMEKFKHTYNCYVNDVKCRIEELKDEVQRLKVDELKSVEYKIETEDE